MIGGLGVGELSIILVIVVVLFGAGRLAGIGSGLGKGIRNFKEEIDTGKGEAKSLDGAAKEAAQTEASEKEKTEA